MDCGIGVGSSSPGSTDLFSNPVVSQHGVLLFCQVKSMLDIVENDLLAMLIDIAAVVFGLSTWQLTRARLYVYLFVGSTSPLRLM